MTRDLTDEAVDAALAAANVMLRVAARSVLEVEDRVTTPQLRVLMLIETAGPQSLTDVAAELAVHASNATRTCDKLVRAGYITRQEDPEDRRYARLDLTDAGRELIEHVLRRRRRAMAEVLNALDESERSAVAAALRTFAEAAGGPPASMAGSLSDRPGDIACVVATVASYLVCEAVTTEGHARS